MPTRDNVEGFLQDVSDYASGLLTHIMDDEVPYDEDADFWGDVAELHEKLKSICKDFAAIESQRVAGLERRRTQEIKDYNSDMAAWRHSVI